MMTDEERYYDDTVAVGKRTFDRPVPAKLVVQCDSGETWDARPADLLRYGFVQRDRFYGLFRAALVRALGGDADLTETPLNPLRYLVEVALFYPGQLHDPELEDTLLEIRTLVHRLYDTDPPCAACDAGTCACVCAACCGRRRLADTPDEPPL